MINKKSTPLKAIKLKCFNCSAYSRAEVKKCPVVDCPLYMFRFGKLKKTQRSLCIDSAKNGKSEEVMKE
jgi:hypothetical protein